MPGRDRFMRLFALISIIGMLSACGHITHPDKKAEETKLNHHHELTGRYRGFYNYPKNDQFISAGCRLELFEKERNKGRFIMGAIDDGWASAVPEFYDGTFAISGDVLELHAERRYLADDEWGHHINKILDSTGNLFRLKLIKLGTSLKLLTDYPKKMELTRLEL
jgi:hypothetical protein